MKKCLILLSMILAGGAFAADADEPVQGEGTVAAKDSAATSDEDKPKDPDEIPASIIGVGFASPLQLPSPDWQIDGVRLDLIYGYNHGVNGLDLGLVGASASNSAGAQLNVLASVDNLDFTGAQLSGFGNAVLGTATGAQLACLLNYNRAAFVGAQLACVNANGASTGLSLGLVNVTFGLSYGCQFGFYNCNRNEFHGWAIGAINYSERHDGLQLGVVNVASVKYKGVQIGLLNSATSGNSCVQIGLMNLNGSADYPILPLINANF